MKINVHAGHNYHVPGASGCFSETSEDRKVKNKVISLLRTAGHTVYDCTDEDGRTQNANLANIVHKCNAHSVDLDVSIHFNAYNGTAHGVEVCVPTGSSQKTRANRICSKIAALGFSDRGIKYRDNLYVLNRTKAPALLIECCFCDSKVDAKLYDADKMAKAIVEGITGQKVPSDESFIVKLLDDVPVRKTASKNSEQIDSEKKGNSFTVIEVSSGGCWYKRKLGGWVAAKKCKRV